MSDPLFTFRRSQGKKGFAALPEQSFKTLDLAGHVGKVREVRELHKKSSPNKLGGKGYDPTKEFPVFSSHQTPKQMVP